MQKIRHMGVHSVSCIALKGHWVATGCRVAGCVHQAVRRSSKELTDYFSSSLWIKGHTFLAVGPHKEKCHYLKGSCYYSSFQLLREGPRQEECQMQYIITQDV